MSNMLPEALINFHIIIAVWAWSLFLHFFSAFLHLSFMLFKKNKFSFFPLWLKVYSSMLIVYKSCAFRNVTDRACLMETTQLLPNDIINPLLCLLLFWIWENCHAFVSSHFSEMPLQSFHVLNSFSPFQISKSISTTSVLESFGVA